MASTGIDSCHRSDANRRHAPLKRCIGFCVLDGMAALMGRDSESGDGIAVEVLVREHEAAIRGVVVVN